jgi:hypothetical protein
LRLTCLIGGANLRRPIVERFQPMLTLKTLLAGFTFQLPFKSCPQKERADAHAFAMPGAGEVIALRKMSCLTPESPPAAATGPARLRKPQASINVMRPSVTPLSQIADSYNARLSPLMGSDLSCSINSGRNDPRHSHSSSSESSGFSPGDFQAVLIERCKRRDFAAQAKQLR